MSTRNQTNQINELNSIIKATVGRSDVHGVGVRAIRDLKKGEKLYLDKLPQMYRLPYASLKQLFPEVRKIILDRWPSIVNGSVFAYPDVRLTSLLNHSETPNYDPYKDEATEFIPEGAEIFENYRGMQNWEKVWKDLDSW